MSEEEFYKWLGERLRDLRKLKKQTQEELCQNYHLARSSLANIERGRHVISAYNLYLLLQVLDAPLESLLKNHLQNSNSTHKISS
ncbi:MULTISPECIES: helix-turn-helix transcriptional regulator [unclassified Paenibacillus]|uniref:helix-turn-helix domain-containing protein n=1 Tax=unclassified Paenibacillus TaxID=185978 RepID=UPI00187B7AAF|nr:MULTISPECIES: helix-turn-helix transcriptional regulator [unclassified Paenibacillus]MBE7680082.1 helix-turn-helix domain-containing protein [Paenibacillus sp. P13VS]MCG7381756.1 helix-turn-helix domain-containing protein [Paenibacillus sp. ACRRY]